MPTALAISSIGASCMPRWSNSARVAVTSSRSRTWRRELAVAAIQPILARNRAGENDRLTDVLKNLYLPRHDGRERCPAESVPGAAPRAARGALAVHPAAPRRLSG